MDNKREYDLSERLLSFASMIIKIVSMLPNTIAGRRIGDQLFKAGTSSGANYQEALGAESKKDFIHKLGITLKELRESMYWLKLINKTGILKHQIISQAVKENDELVRIIAASINTAKLKKK